MNIFVGNLSYHTTAFAIQRLFEAFGLVSNVSLATDRYTGKSRGFAFVEMPDVNCATEAIVNLNGAHINEREIVAQQSARQ